MTRIDPRWADGVRLRPAEAVAAGHPDKICDAIADGIVDLAVGRERRALVGVEVAVHRGVVFVTGRVAGAGLRTADVEAMVRGRYADLGHGADWPPDPASLAVVCDLDLGPLLPGEADFRDVSDDQSICTGYALESPETGWLPPEHWLALRVVRSLEALRRAAPGLRLGPDAKAAVLGAERAGSRMGLGAATVSLQQAIGADEISTRRAVVEVVRSAMAAAPSAFDVPPDLASRVLVNGAGNFECGGPMGDNGLSGKKLVVDAYGPRVPIGGGPSRVRTSSRWTAPARSPPAGSHSRSCGAGSARGHGGAALAARRPRGDRGRGHRARRLDDRPEAVARGSGPHAPRLGDALAGPRPGRSGPARHVRPFRRRAAVEG